MNMSLKNVLKSIRKRQTKIRNKITIVMAYYEARQLLKYHLREWETYPTEYKSHLKIIIVAKCRK